MPTRATMPTPALHADEEIWQAWLRHKSEQGVLTELGISRGRKERHRIKRIVSERMRTLAFEPVSQPEAIRPTAEIIRTAITHRARLQAKLKAKHESVIPVKNGGKPFGIVQIPDQHMDNPGTNLELVFKHAELIRNTDGLYANELGDAIDNFIIGKLEHARREHIVTVREAWALAEEYHKIVAPKLLAAISGNHLEWTHKMGGVDHLQTVLWKAGVQCLYDADELYFSVKADNGRTWKYGMRHFFQGNSMWNAAHSVARYAMSHAYRGEHVIVAGHKHIAGEQIIESRGQKVYCIQTGSYKNRDFDDYCRTKGYMAQHAFLCPVMIHFPETGRSHFFEEIEDAVPFLKYLRRKK